jgi:DNA-binding PadR family transcriptional regulator
MGASNPAAGFGPLDWLAKAVADLGCGPGGPAGRQARDRWAEMGGRHGPGRGWGGGAWAHAGPGFGPWAPGQWAGNPWPFGPGRPRAGKGDVRSAILVLLAEGPRHGYQLIQDIVDRSDGAWRPSPGSVYPTLAALQDEGLVDDEKVEGRRVYSLTPEGREYVADRADELGRVFDSAWSRSRRADDEPGGHDERGHWRSGGVEDYGRLLIGVGAAAVEVARNGTADQVAAARRLLEAARKDLYRLLSDPADAADPADPADPEPAGAADDARARPEAPTPATQATEATAAAEATEAGEATEATEATAAAEATAATEPPAPAEPAAPDGRP